MPEQWIDEHIGDEAIARPEFRTSLRASLAEDLVRPHAPWRAMAWAAGAVVLVAAVAAVIAVRQDDGTPDDGGPSGRVLADAITDRDWSLISVDGEIVSANATLTFGTDGSFSGSDGCNDFNASPTFDPAVPDAGWRLDGETLTMRGVVQTAMGCLPDNEARPYLDTARLSLSQDGTMLTMTGEQTLVLSTDPLTARVQDRRWYVQLVDGEQVTVNAWFELRSDGTFVGSDGCNDYGSTITEDPTDRAWRFDRGVLRVSGSIDSTAVGCEFDPFQPLVDGAQFGFYESYDDLVITLGGTMYWTTPRQYVLD